MSRVHCSKNALQILNAEMLSNPLFFVPEHKRGILWPPPGRLVNPCSTAYLIIPHLEVCKVFSLIFKIPARNPE